MSVTEPSLFTPSTCWVVTAPGAYSVPAPKVFVCDVLADIAARTTVGTALNRTTSPMKTLPAFRRAREMDIAQLQSSPVQLTPIMG